MGLARLDLARQAGLTQFGEPVTYSPQAGGTIGITGVWRGEHIAVELGAGETELTSVAPALGVDLAEFVAQGHAAFISSGDHEDLIGDTLVRAGRTYKVSDVKADGQGGAELILHLVSG